MNAYETARILVDMAKQSADGTVDALDKPLPTHGYWVGGRVESLVYKGVESIDQGEVSWFVGSHDSRYYGVWVDSADNRIYFDVVDWEEWLSDATDLATERGEIAIWDVGNEREVRVKADQNYQDPEAAA